MVRSVQVTLLLLAVVCASEVVVQAHPPEGSRVINGKDAQLGQFPYQALVMIDTPRGRALCGGSLVNEEWILTAGHCVEDATSFEITLGAINMKSTEDDGRIVMNSTEFIRHEDYRPESASNDVAVIKLPSQVQYSSRVQPVQLPTGHDDYNRRQAVVSGFGKTRDMGGASPKLQYATLQVISNGECRLLYWSNIQSTTLCTRGDQSSTCNGDSGGPLVLEDDKTLIGVVSFGHVVGCEKKLPVAFARVTEFADWIREKTGMTTRAPIRSNLL